MLECNRCYGALSDKDAGMTKAKRKLPEAEYLRNARRQVGLTQYELAEASEELPHPITREFVANLETRGLYGTVKKFLTYWQLTRFDLALLSELVSVRAAEPQAIPDTRTLVRRCRELYEVGKLREGLELALAGARRAAGRGNTSAQAQCLLTASILAGNGKYWHLARDLIEETLSLDALSPQDTARAKLQHAYTLSGFDRHTIALDILSTIDTKALKADPALGGQYWHGVAQARKHNGDYSEALKASRKAWARHREAGDSAAAATAFAIEAECLDKLGRVKRARRQADEAIREAEGSRDEFAQCAALCCAGHLALQDDDLSAADLFLRRCIRTAERIGHRPMACEARIEQYALELRRGRKRMTERLAGRLRKETALVPLDRETLDRFRDLDQKA